MLDVLAFLHQRFAFALALFALLLIAWGTYLFIRHRRLSGGFRSSFLLMAGLTAVECILGLGAFLAGGRPHQILHVVYGIFAIAFLPGVFVYAGRRALDTEAWLLPAACGVVLVAYVRGITTGA